MKPTQESILIYEHIINFITKYTNKRTSSVYVHNLYYLIYLNLHLNLDYPEELIEFYSIPIFPFLWNFHFGPKILVGGDLLKKYEKKYGKINKVLSEEMIEICDSILLLTENYSGSYLFDILSEEKIYKKLTGQSLVIEKKLIKEIYHDVKDIEIPNRSTLFMKCDIFDYEKGK